MGILALEVLTPDKSLYLGRATSIIAKAIDGEVAIYPGHTPYVNVLAPGDLRVHTEENTCLHFHHGGGVLEVSREKTKVLVLPLDSLATSLTGSV